jgi:DNA repair exonuclease SbcCD ATPase subunit
MLSKEKTTLKSTPKTKSIQRTHRTLHRTPLTEKMSVTMSADAHTQMTNEINALGQEVRELKKNEKAYENKIFCLDNHINGLKKQNKELKEDNKMLKDGYEEELQGWKDLFDDEYQESSDAQEKLEELKANADLIDDIQMTQQKREEEWKHDYKVAELRKEKIEELQKFAIDVHNFAYRTEWDDTDIVSAMDFDAIVKKMKEDEKEQELDLFRADTSVYTAEGLSDKLQKEIESLKKSNKQKTKLIHKFREQVKTLEQRTMIYSILDETYKSMPKSKKEWIDVNWKSIINGFADNLEEMVPDEEDDDEDEYSHIECGDCNLCGCYHSEYDPCKTNCARD